MGADDAALLAGMGLLVVNGQLTTSIASWDITLTGYVLLDYDAGSDANPGLIVAAQNTTFTAGQISATAIKTWDRLLEVLPRFGCGRRLNILIKGRAAGATYRNRANTADADLDLRFFYGYQPTSLCRGSTDLTNSATDQQLCGAITSSAGPNGDGSWTCAAGATTLDLTVAAGALPADLTGTGLRARMSGIVTGALANQCRHVHSVLAGTLEAATAWSVAPAAGDTFFLEAPGAAFAKIMVGMSDAAGGGFAVVGLTAAATSGTPVSTSGSTGAFTLAFVHETGAALTSSFNNVEGSFSISNGYTADDGTFHTVGGCRFAGPATVVATAVSVTIGSSSFLASGAVRALRVQQGSQVSIGRSSACTINAGLMLDRCGVVSSSGNNTPGVLIGRGATATVPRTRILAPLTDGSGVLFINGGGGLLHGIDVTGMGGASAIRLLSNGAALGVMDCTGTTGNTGVGLLISGSGNSVHLDPTNTISGTQGNISSGGVTGGVIGAFADLSLTNYIDEGGNNFYGEAVGSISPRCVVDQGIPVTNASGGALPVGTIVRTNGTTGQITSAQANTGANSTGVVGVLVTAPANNALGYMVVSGAPYVRFSAAPVAGGLVYLDQANPGQATTTVPPVAATNQKLRLGYHVRTISGNNSLTAWQPELVPVLSNGAAP